MIDINSIGSAEGPPTYVFDKNNGNSALSIIRFYKAASEGTDANGMTSITRQFVWRNPGPAIRQLIVENIGCLPWSEI
jgi:hypothetical protein